MLKVRVVATAFAAVLAVAVTACGAQQPVGTTSAQSQGSPGDAGGSRGPASSDGGTSSKNGGSDAATGSGAAAVTGPAPKGSYDDTSGTKARKPSTQSAVLHQLPGAAAGRCVTVGDRTDVRSGSLGMGNFRQARTDFGKAKSAYQAAPSFFYLIPRSRSAVVATVVATRLGGHAPTVRVRTHDVEKAAQWRYFPIHLQVPASGTWRFQVTAGAERGCFVASFRQ